jgi:hypothetical protein
MREDTIKNRRGRQRREEEQEQMENGGACMHADVSLACSCENVRGGRGCRSGSTITCCRAKRATLHKEQELDTALHLLNPS